MRFLITAGPTREAVDPVRYLTNRSTGRMGYALAGAARHEGHEVLLISGPTALDVPDGVDFLSVTSAQQMYEAVRDMLHGTDVAILSAAVADYRPVVYCDRKIKKKDGRITLELERTPDILGSMRRVFNYTGVLIGFAAETENLLDNARLKLLRKGCDMVVANNVGQANLGFGATENEVWLLRPGQKEEKLPRDTKHRLALRIVQEALLLCPHRS